MDRLVMFSFCMYTYRRIVVIKFLQIRLLSHFTRLNCKPLHTDSSLFTTRNIVPYYNVSQQCSLAPQSSNHHVPQLPLQQQNNHDGSQGCDRRIFLPVVVHTDVGGSAESLADRQGGRGG
jgi:hypothetical protein